MVDPSSSLARLPHCRQISLQNITSGRRAQAGLSEGVEQLENHWQAVALSH